MSVTPRFQPVEAEIGVLTYKEGLLSRVAHDLLLRPGDVHVEVDPAAAAVRVRVAAASLRVIDARKGGRDTPGVLSAKDRREIEDNLRREVLHPERHPEIRFEGHLVDAHRVSGTLSLHGHQRPVSAVWREERGWRIAEVELDQREFGIEPYRAMMGALKIKARVVVELRVRWPEE